MEGCSVKRVVDSVYASIAKSSHEGSQAASKVAQAFGYSEEELSSIPKEANMGLSCGNATKYANLKEGEVVVDLGCGGGLDCFLAAQKVGPSGKVIGVDVTKEMIALATKNAAAMGDKAANASFCRGDAEDIPLEDCVADCVMSNCVLNLVPDKSRAFREIHRILKPGGRLAASDIAMTKPLPTELRTEMIARTGCIAGAISIEEYTQKLHEAGFADVVILDMEADLNVYTELGPNACAPSAQEIALCCDNGSSGEGLCAGAQDKPVEFDVNAFAASVRVMALKQETA